MSIDSDQQDAVRAHLSSRQLHPKSDWLASFFASARTNTPLPALKKSAEWKLLASDITESLDKDITAPLPSRATDVTVKEQRLQQPLIVQVLDIEDLGRSRWSQIELIEQQERGEMTRGREIIRLAPDGEDGTLANTDLSRGPHKFLVQDAHGTKMYAFEMNPVHGVDLTMAIGAKLLIRTAVIARGMILLEPSQTELLGGKVAPWAEQWTKGRKAMLKSRLPDSVDQPGAWSQ
ncbi:hypothetical protein CAC42_1130 [Sphaceloma murrayae]|uniref:RecQ-mediated genome instability protein 1 n=1 Tax=Sphaceloma murrayae TaxID=2082308 RepID=A0A2K1R243_9PEZI|nr:hypothetical protein CAC42_1130 [Sphaceloma murrayae]